MESLLRILSDSPTQINRYYPALHAYYSHEMQLNNAYRVHNDSNMLSPCTYCSRGFATYVGNDPKDRSILIKKEKKNKESATIRIKCVKEWVIYVE